MRPILLLALASAIHAADSDATLISRACLQTLGTDCTASTDGGFYKGAQAFFAKQPAAARTQDAVVSKVIAPRLSKDSSLREQVVIRAYQSLGRTPTMADKSKWTSSYSAGQTFLSLKSQIAMTPAAKPTPPVSKAVAPLKKK
jgi:hypothetical protein